MSLARRVRDYRFAKGWGPDELSSRAAISRTALYQIESGKTELPRAATLQRIAQALGVSMEVLLQDVASPEAQAPRARPIADTPARALTIERDGLEWAHNERTHAPQRAGGYDAAPAAMALAQSSIRIVANGHGRPHARNQAEIEQKFRELLESPLGEGLAHLVEDSHKLLRTGA